MLKTTAGIGVFAISLLFWYQDKLLYIPSPSPDFPRKYSSDPSSLGIPFERLHLTAEDGTNLVGWFLKQKQSQEKTTIVYFHANAGGMNHRLYSFKEFFDKHKVNVLAVEYRGFGESEGVASEEGIKLDSKAFFKFVQESPLIDENNVVLFGRSLGGAVSLFLASELEQNGVRLKGIIVENTFLSIKLMATKLMPFLKPFSFFLKRPLLVNEWKTVDIIGNIKSTPILFISGRSDELVPKEHMDTLFDLFLDSATEEAKSKSVFYSVKGGRHNDTPMAAGPQYNVEIANFLSNL